MSREELPESYRELSTPRFTDELVRLVEMLRVISGKLESHGHHGLDTSVSIHLPPADDLVARPGIELYDPRVVEGYPINTDPPSFGDIDQASNAVRRTLRQIMERDGDW